MIMRVTTFSINKDNNFVGKQSIIQVFSAMSLLMMFM